MNGHFSSRTEFINTASVFLELSWNHPDRHIGLVIQDGRLTFLIPSGLRDELAAGILAAAPDAEINLGNWRDE